jgi:ABC-type thiamin/hydroxymethylpyrimidine transport system permease subunit
MEHENPGQVEAALNTFANSGEICGVAFGIWFLLGALSMLFIKKGSVSGKLAIAGVRRGLFHRSFLRRTMDSCVLG